MSVVKSGHPDAARGLPHGLAAARLRAPQRRALGAQRHVLGAQPGAEGAEGAEGAGGVGWGGGAVHSSRDSGVASRHDKIKARSSWYNINKRKNPNLIQYKYSIYISYKYRYCTVVLIL